MNSYNELEKLKRELKRLEHELDMAKRNVKHANDELAKTKQYYRDKLPDLGGQATANLKRIKEILGAISIYKRNSRMQIAEIRDRVDVSTLATLESIDFFMSKIALLIKGASELCEPDKMYEDEPVIIGSSLYDFVFQEFKVDSTQRKLSINGKTIAISKAEFSHFIELLKKPNQEVHFNNPEQARTTLSRLRHRVPELKSLIVSVFGTGGYRLQVTPITTK